MHTPLPGHKSRNGIWSETSFRAGNLKTVIQPCGGMLHLRVVRPPIRFWRGGRTSGSIGIRALLKYYLLCS